MRSALIRDVTQVVPALPPAVNGLGDYAFILAQELRKLGVDSRFIVAGMPPGKAADVSVEDFRFQLVQEQRAEALAEALEDAGSDTVLVHFVGYAYAHWGLCFWLVDGLREWKGQSRKRRIITMFHELYACGPPWRVSFWTWALQYRIARSLAFASDALVCGYALVDGKLRAWRPIAPVRLMPVFSNVGELDDPPPLTDREALAVVFGGAGSRHRLYKNLSQHPASLTHLGIAQVLDIGPSVNVPPVLDGIPVRSIGTLPREEVSSIMTRARVGLADYPLHVVAKSGILAAYHAHGLLCVNLSRIGRLKDDIVEGQHFVGHERLSSGSFDGAAVAAFGHRWYCDHDRAHTARHFVQLIGVDVPDS